jgi:hypothetical protein
MNTNTLAKSSRLLRGGVVLLVLVGVAGCGARGTVSGKVYYQDKVVTGGRVFFVAEGYRGESEIGADGSYSISNVPAGQVKIFLSTDEARNAGRPSGLPMPPKDKVPEEAANNPIYNKTSKPSGIKYVEIPKIYNDPESSGLTYDVKGGDQEYDIKLK